MKSNIKVVHISDDECQVSLNIGAADKVSKGDRFLVYALSEHEIFDPDTKESLGFLEFVKGVGEVIHVQEKLCTISSTKRKKPKTIIRKQSPQAFSFSMLGTQSTVEETVIDPNNDQAPFDNPEIGDLAKPV